MSLITQKSSIKEIAAIVSEKLTEKGINAVLSGGAVVSIYTENEYESKDLDFVCGETLKTIALALVDIGFVKTESRYFTHPSTEYFIEFPQAPLAIGDEIQDNWSILETSKGTIKLLSPTQSTMDRLAGYFHWNDLQNLDQAVMVACRHPIKLEKIKSWSKSEGHEEKFKEFIKQLNKQKRTI